MDVRPAALEGPITIGKLVAPVDPRPVDLAAIGYVQEEWFAGGTACAYTTDAEPAPDGHWSVNPAGAATYRTRFLVRRPTDLDRFSGTVVIEWLNVSAVETAPDWAYVGEVIVDEGAAWVGVSVQAFGVVGGQSLIDTGAAQQARAAEGGIRAANPERYGSLEHPGDRYAFDIFAQVGAALRSPDNAPVFGGAEVKTLIAIGESQSAGFLTAYINAVQPISDVFDGFFVHSRGAGAARLDGYPAIRGSAVAYRIRDDLDAPVLVFETETDVGPLLRFAAARQQDTAKLRTWEVAGTAHADAHLVGRSFRLCPHGVNDGPQHWVAKAALAALFRWVADGTEPPRAQPLSTEGDDGTTIQRTELGLARGGVRTPSVDVPLSALSGEAPPGSNILCALFGSSIPFAATTLSSLYPTVDAYLEQFDSSLSDAVARGFVRSSDRERYAEETRVRATELLA